MIIFFHIEKSRFLESPGLHSILIQSILTNPRLSETNWPFVGMKTVKSEILKHSVGYPINGPQTFVHVCRVCSISLFVQNALGSFWNLKTILLPSGQPSLRARSGDVTGCHNTRSMLAISSSAAIDDNRPIRREISGKQLYQSALLSSSPHLLHSHLLLLLLLCVLLHIH